MTEKQKIRGWFKRRKYLTVAQAIHFLRVYNLRSRVPEMPDVEFDCMIPIVREDGVLAHVARYQRVGE